MATLKPTRLLLKQTVLRHHLRQSNLLKPQHLAQQMSRQRGHQLLQHRLSLAQTTAACPGHLTQMIARMQDHAQEGMNVKQMRHASVTLHVQHSILMPRPRQTSPIYVARRGIFVSVIALDDQKSMLYLTNQQLSTNATRRQRAQRVMSAKLERYVIETLNAILQDQRPLMRSYLEHLKRP